MDLSFERASSIFICQSTPRCVSLTSRCEKADEPNEQVLLSSLLEPAMLLIPHHDRHVLVPPRLLIELNPAVTRILNAFYGIDPNGWDYLVEIGFPGWEQWCREKLTVPKSAAVQLPGTETCVYSEPTGMTSYRRWLAFGGHYRIHSLPVAMKRKEETSVMFVCDFFNAAETGQEQLKRILGSVLGTVANGSEALVAPPTKLGQIRKAFDLRAKKKFDTGQ